MTKATTPTTEAEAPIFTPAPVLIGAVGTGATGVAVATALVCSATALFPPASATTGITSTIFTGAVLAIGGVMIPVPVLRGIHAVPVAVP
jgi:hypothetical protein